MLIQSNCFLEGQHFCLPSEIENIAKTTGDKLLWHFQSLLLIIVLLFI